MSSSPFLTKLPIELRVEIYSYLVRFTRPIKLNQITPGSKDLSLLQTNHQIHTEALSVLYDINSIVATRNDFCQNTSASMKAPLPLAETRHLHIKTLSRSIACTLRDEAERCEVCQASATGLFRSLSLMPMLRTVTIEVSWNSNARFKAVIDQWHGVESHSGARRPGRLLNLMNESLVGRTVLADSAVHSLGIEYRCVLPSNGT